MGRTTPARTVGTYLVGLAVSVSLTAQVAPPRSPLAATAFKHQDPRIDDGAVAINRLPPGLANAARQDLAALGVAEGNALLDPRGSRFATLLLSHPLIPGSGSGNSLTWSSLGLAEPTEPIDLE